MFERLRQLEISLAAKCQLLFGAAVVLIIAAALFVPWQRMEQLTDQINEKSAKALAETAKAQHLWWATLPEEERARVPMPSRITGGATTLPVNGEGRVVAVPRLVALWDPPQGKLPAFLRRSMDHFRKHPNFESYAQDFENRDGTDAVRFALALRAEASCVRCHSGPILEKKLVDLMGGTVSMPAATTTQASAVAGGAKPQAATTAPAIPAGTLIGLVEVEMRSQVETRQLLLNRIFLLTAGLLAGTL